jgi:hemerythrin superfamily protein
MNAIELLKKDHQTVKSLFESFEKAKEQKDVESKKSLFESIRQELEAHTRVEEEIFYPAFDQTAGQEDEDDKELVLEAGEEHQQVKVLLADLSDMEPDDETFDAKMKVMKDNVEHHVEEEEGEMFPHAQKQLSSDELEQLGQRIETLKERIQSEPEPASDRRRSARRSQGGRSARAASASRRSGSQGGSTQSRSASSSRVSSARGSSRSASSRGRGRSASRSGSSRSGSSRSSASRSGRGRSTRSSSGRGRSSSSRSR